MNTSVLPELPPDLAARAAAVPGLPLRLLHFIRQEVALYERRQSHYSPQAKEIVRLATERAEELKRAGLTPERSREEFLELYTRLIANRTNDE